ncbi:ricin-type beta-trefoil lectin domain protein [Streptomyces sp. AV19]|uniref:RICIN domain-containing protein n=1 Tax=Streptomyces sp. AV19 TaxID=2793068 RepID=UPI0018FE3FC9|nr:RICIN domain-containing protein [Streptomyces sp. AV19]MBH1933071.1 ricin-type beta-trefoil lectin domain protein [Streptomyces sp. AV19]MDG4531783.1 RICIN domain-containing protein [Streptomyces sp. AV19]
MRAALAVGASIAALAGGATTAYADPADTSSYVRLRAEHSDKCLTIESARIGEGANAVQQSCADDLDNQLFGLKSVGSGTLSVRAKHSGRCLGAGQSTDWDVQQLWCADDSSSQRWRVMLVEVGKGLYELRPVDALEYCLTIPGYSQDEGAKASIYSCNGASSQRWRMVPASS